MGLLDGKVALITGAGGGIGRAHALAFAREGARVVVNDLGGSRDGAGATSSMADGVVAEIVAMGGDAVANYDSVTDAAGCERMVKAALDRWGKLDVVVNNAGILRDRTFMKMSDAEWDLVLAVHLAGTRNVTRAAIPALQAQGGAIINTTSYSGMIGNFGQSNYAAAKAGIYGLTRVLSMELRKSGITVNAIAPVAKTRMTEELAMIDADWKPEQISPIVVFLASDLGKNVTGTVFGVQGQRLYLYEVKTNDGVEKPGHEPWTVAEIAEKYADITRWDAPAAAGGGADDVVTQVFAHFPAGFRAEAAKGWNAVIHWQVKSGTNQTITVQDGVCTVSKGLVGSATCTVKVYKEVLVQMLTGELDPQKAFMSGKASADNMGDLIKLATAFDFKKIAKSYQGGAAPAPEPAKSAEAAPAPAADAGPKPPPIGKRYDGGWAFVDRKDTVAYADATDDTNARYRGDGAIAPPMYHVAPILAVMMKAATDPELGLDLLRLVHGEHAMTFHRALRHGDIVDLRGELQGIEEKSSGRVAYFRLYGFVDGKPAFEGTTTYFVRGKKRADAPKEAPAAPPPEPPAPDLEIQQVVTEDQALRYATVSGDNNPIHTDEAVARSAGLPRTILHGLCTMAFAQRDLVNALCGGDPERLGALSVRFARPVFPGDTLTLRVWGTSGEIGFETRNAAGEVVIANGRATIRA